MSSSFVFVTQSYRADLEECTLLCESMDKFCSPEIPHYLIVNDEDYGLFKSHPAFHSRHIYPKSSLLPAYFFRLPFRMLGHSYLVSPLTIPVREWIVQQLCKLAIFSILPPEVEAVVNLDSECVFVKPFDVRRISRQEAGGSRRWAFYRRIYEEEPCHEEYCSRARQFFLLSPASAELEAYTYMTQGVIFHRDNLRRMLDAISRGSITRNWLLRLANTYRFSEFYCYGIYTHHILGDRNHYLYDYRLFPVKHVVDFNTEEELLATLRDAVTDDRVAGIWLQKGKRGIAGTLTPAEVGATVRRFLREDTPLSIATNA